MITHREPQCTNSLKKKLKKKKNIPSVEDNFSLLHMSDFNIGCIVSLASAQQYYV